MRITINYPGPFARRSRIYQGCFSTACALFLFGLTTNFEVTTCLVLLGPYRNITATQAILVEVDPDAPSYKTYLVTNLAEDLNEAYELLYVETPRLIYQKLAENLEENARVEAGQTTLEGSLDW
ncbi:hypothetical protein VTK26DRAFT_4415 [Humicola hyalothermophila]